VLAKAKESASKEILDEGHKLNNQTKQEIKTEDKEISPQLKRTEKQKMNPSSPPFIPNTIPDNFASNQQIVCRTLNNHLT